MANLERSYKRDMEEIGPSKPSETYYPHRLHLDAEDVEALNLMGATVGQMLVVVAQAEVTSVSISERSEGKKRHSVELTLKEAEVSEKKKSKGETLYSEMKDN